MNDLISRQVAISLPVMPKKYRKCQTYNLDDAYEQGWEDLQKCIERLPSAQSQWIPCSERLPELYEDVLITDSDGVVDIASMDEYWDGDETKRKWYLSNYGFINVLAWMPLPEPYGGESE